MSFLKIIFTPPEPFEGESQALTRLIESGAADFIHLRHPGASEEIIRGVVAGIPKDLRKKIRIHDHFILASEYELGGVHLNGRNPLSPDRNDSVSRSCHSVDESREFIKRHPGYAYVTLSPIFDSISKKGYMSAKFDPEELNAITASERVIALGGVEPRHFSELARLGFSGGAMLGYVWNNPEGKKLSEIVEEINSISL